MICICFPSAGDSSASVTIITILTQHWFASFKVEDVSSYGEHAGNYGGNLGNYGGGAGGGYGGDEADGQGGGGYVASRPGPDHILKIHWYRAYNFIHFKTYNFYCFF